MPEPAGTSSETTSGARRYSKAPAAAWLAIAAAAMLTLLALWPAPVLALGGAVVPAGFWMPERVGRVRIVLAAYAAALAVVGLLRLRLPPAHPAVRPAAHFLQPARVWAVAGLLVLAAAAVRGRYVNAPLDYDEAYSFLHYARGSLLEALARYDSTNNHLLNSMFMWLGHRLFGPSEWALRLAAFLPGILLPGLIYLAAHRLGQTVGALAAGLIAVWSPALVEYATNGRGYSWAAAATAAAVIVLARNGLGSRRDRLLLTSAAVSALWAVPVCLPLVFGLAVWLVLARSSEPLAPRLRDVLSWLVVAGMVGAALYVPGYVALGLHAARNPFVQPLAPSLWLVRFPLAVAEGLGISLVELPMDGVAAKLHGGAVSVWRDWIAHGTTVTAAIAAYVPVAAAPLLVRDRRRWLLPALLLAGYLLLFAAARLAPPPRVFVPMLPLQLLLVGAVLDVLLKPLADSRAFVAGLTSVVLLATAGFYAARPLPYRPSVQCWRLDVPEAVGIVKQHAHGAPFCVLASLPADMPLRFYLERSRLNWRWGADRDCGQCFLLWLGATAVEQDAVRRDPVLRSHADELARRRPVMLTKLRRAVLYRMD